MRQPTGRALIVVAAALALAGCQPTRQNYMAVSVGQTQDQVRKILGTPRYQFAEEWVYTMDDPRDLTKVTIRFDADGKVAGKSWQNPEEPWQNHREGQVP